MESPRAASSSSSAQQLLRLPDGIFSIVVACLLSPDDIRTAANARWPQKVPPLVLSLMSVCRAWESLILEIISARALVCFTITLPKPTRKSVVELRRQLILRRSRTRELALDRIPSDESIDGIGFWHNLLSYAPHTTVVDLTHLHKKSRSFTKRFFIAAGWQLRLVHTLRLPLHKLGSPYAEWMHNLIASAMKTLALWYRLGDSGGLRVLRASLSEWSCTRESATELFETFSKFTPKLQQLDTNLGEFGGISEEQWVLDLNSWTRFCQSCTSLTEWDWLRVPFATSFFETFGQHTQPNLTKLTLRTALNWDWNYYMSENLPEICRNLTERGFGGTAVHAWAALKACPNLRDLHIDRILPHASVGSRMHPELFGDEFYEQLAKTCPLLEQLLCVSNSSFQSEQPMIESFTDRSLKALATLPHLQTVELSAKNITGNAIYDLVVHQAAAPIWTKRQYRILVGESQQDASTDMATFYHIMLRFLHRLEAEDDPSVVIARPVSLWLVNHSARTAGESWYATYLDDIRQLVSRIQCQHPRVTLRIALVQEEDGEWGHQIGSFGFHTPQGRTEPWDQGCFTDRQGHYDDEILDDVFVRHFHNELYFDENESLKEFMDE